MKKFSIGILAGLAILCCVAAAYRFPIYSGLLQSDLDAGINNATNVNEVHLLGLVIQTNVLTSWRTNAPYPGAAYLVNSNGTIFLITSGPNSSTWAATNKLAP